MIILLSPAKSLDYSSEFPATESSLPRLIDDSEELVQRLRQLSEAELGSLMSISDKLATLNVERYVQWERDFTQENSRPALFAFTGDVYQGIDFASWSAEEFDAAQQSIRILSGLYGVLRPLDAMQPYRLEMGTKLENARGKNLYEFWGNKVTELLNQDLENSGSSLVVNLASNEYFKSVKKKSLNGELVSPVFKDEKNGTYKVISFYAKKARGMMADYIVRHGITEVAQLKGFNTAGYYYDEASSKPDAPVFLRDEQ
ncbi:peroxide stress protein YaaA [Rubritalea marina]|uniref:peroxide stress protein YaaA n=1 Tax=Rubritalea marina TaxID=361055 RepID=UPI00037082EB|nr:peroxide stress protein YaaA [Rubritalea marina]